MDSKTYIKERQVLWAIRTGIALQGSKGEKGYPAYTHTLRKNMFESLSRDALHQFRNADGNELGNGITPGKIQAVHSSSALACNMFHYWQSRRVYSPIAQACKIPAYNIQSVEFEAKLPIGDNIDRRRFPNDPNIDVLFLYSRAKHKAIGIECKFTEAYSNRSHNGLRPEYIKTEELWGELPAIYSFAQSISPQDLLFLHLHPAQLIKHILGLKHAFGKDKFRLLYLWYDVPFGDGNCHREEIERFAEVAKRDGVVFQAITYQEVILNLAKKQRQHHQKYVDYMVERYL